MLVADIGQLFCKFVHFVFNRNLNRNLGNFQSIIQKALCAAKGKHGFFEILGADGKMDSHPLHQI